MIVVDASVAVKWALPEFGREEARVLLKLGHRLAAPDLIYAEVANVFRKRVRQGEMTSSQAEEALSALVASIVMAIPSKGLAADALRFATKLDHSAYDCFYLAAAANTSYLVTADDVFVRKCASAEMLEGRIVSLSNVASIPIGNEVRIDVS